MRSYMSVADWLTGVLKYEEGVENRRRGFCIFLCECHCDLTQTFCVAMFTYSPSNVWSIIVILTFQQQFSIVFMTVQIFRITKMMKIFSCHARCMSIGILLRESSCVLLCEDKIVNSCYNFSCCSEPVCDMARDFYFYMICPPHSEIAACVENKNLVLFFSNKWPSFVTKMGRKIAKLENLLAFQKLTWFGKNDLSLSVSKKKTMH